MRAFLLVLALAAPLAAAQPTDGLVGEWRLTGSTASAPPATGDYIPTPPSAPYRLAFADNGSVVVEAGMDLQYTFDGQTLSIRASVDGAYEPIGASIDGDTLTISDPDDGTLYVYVRDGGTASDGIVGRWLRPDAVSGETSAPPAGFEFATDGTSRVLYIATMRYVAERGTLSISDPLQISGNVRVSGDRMRLVQKDLVSTYARATDAAEAEPVVVLQRTACYGRCPEYTLAAYADGRVVWTGRRNVARIGTAERRVEPAVVAALVAQAEAAGHAGLPAMLAGGGVCTEVVSDMPGAVTTVRTAGTHSVTHDGGCRGLRGEAALTAFETAIDRALGTPELGAAPTR